MRRMKGPRVPPPSPTHAQFWFRPAREGSKLLHRVLLIPQILKYFHAKCSWPPPFINCGVHTPMYWPAHFPARRQHQPQALGRHPVQVCTSTALPAAPAPSARQQHWQWPAKAPRQRSCQQGAGSLRTLSCACNGDSGWS